MGTNYYLYEPDTNHCSCCGRYDAGRKLHIGRSLFGWCFALHVDYPIGENDWEPRIGVSSLDDWKNLFKIPGNVIKDENGKVISVEDMIQIITERKSDQSRPIKRAISAIGKTIGESGPNGLIRSKIDKEHCIGHGEGTWDYIVGEFS